MALEDLRGQIIINTESIDRATDAIERLEKTLNTTMRSTQKATDGASKNMSGMGKATEKASQQTQKYTKQAQTATKQTQGVNKETIGFKRNMENLTKSTQVALGPLSGVAARITALTALFNRNAAVLATLLAGFTAFTVALGRAIRVGQQFEQEMLGINAVLEATGRASRTSAEEIGEMARRLGRDTLTSASEARQALTQLSTFQNVSTQQFEETTTAALGLGRAMGGNLQSNIRRIGRLLNNPIENLSSLTRAGIQFTEQEQRKIETLQRSGRLHDAQAMILERLSAFTRLAQEESGGLAGAFDTLSERINQVFEESSATSTLLETMTDVVTRLTERVNEFLENEDAVRRLGEVFSTFARSVGNTLIFLIDNIERISFVITTLLVSSIITKLIPAFGAAVTALGGLKAATQSYIAVLTGKAAAVNVVTVSLRGMLVALGPIGAAIAIVSLAASRFSDEASITEQATRDLEESFEDASGPTRNFTRALNENTLQLQNQARIRIDSVNSQITALKAQRVQLARNIEEEEKYLRQQSGFYAAADEQRALISDLKSEYDDLGNQIDLLSRQLDNNKSTLESHTRTAEKEIDTVNNLTDSILSLRREYDREGEQARRLQDNLEALNTSREKIAQMGEGQILALADALGVSAESADEARDSIERMFSTIESGMRDAGPQAEDFSSQIDSVANSFRNVNDQIRQTEAALRGQPLGFDMSDIRQLEELGMPQLGEVAGRVGVDISGITSEEQARIRLAEALHTQRTELERLQEIERLESDLLGPQGDSMQAQLGRLEAEYNEQRALLESFESDKTQIMLRNLDQRYQQQREAIRREEAGIQQLEEDLAQMRLDRLDPVERVRAEFEERRNAITEAYAMETEMKQAHLEKLNELEAHYLDEALKKQQEIEQQRLEATMGMYQNAFGNMAGFMRTALGEQHGLYKAFAIAEAVMAGAIAYNKALAEGGPIAGPALAASIAVQTGAQVATIAAQSFATGGMVRGPGSGTSDSIPAFLSNGEFVMTADAVNRIGAGNLQNMNQGEAPRFATGGEVGDDEREAPPSSSGEGIRIINVMDESVVEDFMNSSKGERIVTNIMSKNQRYNQRAIR